MGRIKTHQMVVYWESLLSALIDAAAVGPLERTGLVIVWFVMCAAAAAAVTAFALFIYAGRDKPARRPYREAGYLAFGATWGLLALGRYLGDSGPRWMVWLCAALAVLTPLSIWEERRQAAKKD